MTATSFFPAQMGKAIARHVLVLATGIASVVPGVVVAQDWTMVNFMARDLNKDDPAKAYRGAIAACLAGRGDVEKTAAFFTEAGWTRNDETEMGTVDYVGPDQSLYVLQADDGSFCAAYSETQGSDTAIGNIQIVGGAGGFSFDHALSEGGCDSYALAPGVSVEITSSGNDPVCSDSATSSVRFTFGPG